MMTHKESLADLATRTQAVYERNARAFDAQRHSQSHKAPMERPWLHRFLALVPQGGRVLDLGCGGGVPIAAHLMAQGFAVTGVDASAAMLEIVRARFPDGDWRPGDMRSLDLGERFDGLIAWDSIFHLTRDEQRTVLPLLAAHLRPRAPLLLTVGPAEGEVAGRVGADAVYHASLSPDEYRQRLEALGLHWLAFVPEDPTCGGHTVLLARAGNGGRE